MESVRIAVFIVSLLTVLSLPTIAQAVCPTTPCGPNNKLVWTAPTTNTDSTPLTDFGGFEVIFGTISGNCINNTGTVRDVGAQGVPAAPLANTIVKINLSILSLGNTGQKFAAVKAYDTTGNRSACSIEVSFPFDGISPAIVPTPTLE